MTARRAAYDALTAVIRDGAYTSLALKNHIPSGMPEVDRRFASSLVRTTLENLLRIDYALRGFLRSGRVHGSVRNVLRLGACQILYMDTEDYAAVSESVALVKTIKPQMAGFVNAVLRALAAGKASISYPQGKNAETLSIETSYPVWICEKYIADFGYDFAYALLSYRESGGTAVRLNTLRANTEQFEHALNVMGLEYSRGNIQNAYIIKGLSDIEATDIYKNGWIAVQSESAMRAVMEAEIQPGERLLDACAAPGGKSAFAAALADNRLSITAWDVHEHRVDMTVKNYARLGVTNAAVLLHDAREYVPEYENGFDTVIVDAPCSAMGLMAHSPDVRYSRKPEDVESLSPVQRDILSTCARYVKPGGKLAYFTCSINKEENEMVTGGFLNANGAFEYVKQPVTIYPHLSGSDGFYIAVMKRRV